MNFSEPQTEPKCGCPDCGGKLVLPNPIEVERADGTKLSIEFDLLTQILESLSETNQLLVDHEGERLHAVDWTMTCKNAGYPPAIVIGTVDVGPLDQD